MATVYLARTAKHDRLVALKVLHPDLAASLGPDRFLREIKLAARLNHPHILPLFDSGEADGFLYYVMPYVEGESLRERLDSRAAAADRGSGASSAAAIASALDYAHRQGIVHRDIKPENVMLYEGEAMVMDFGIAKARERRGTETLTQTGMMVGTPAYVSPEQAAGEDRSRRTQRSVQPRVRALRDAHRDGRSSGPTAAGGDQQAIHASRCHRFGQCMPETTEEVESRREGAALEGRVGSFRTRRMDFATGARCESSVHSDGHAAIPARALQRRNRSRCCRSRT